VPVEQPKQPITTKYTNIEAFLTDCDCNEHIEVFKDSKLRLKQLPQLTRQDLMETLRLPLGSAMAIEELAHKFAAA
jgi:hypothetical protein